MLLPGRMMDVGSKAAKNIWIMTGLHSRLASAGAETAASSCLTSCVRASAHAEKSLAHAMHKVVHV